MPIYFILFSTANNIHIIMITTFLLPFCFIFYIPLFFYSISALNSDEATLLSFKHSLLSNQPSILLNWYQSDITPCSWSGVTCENGSVIGLQLQNSLLLGSIPNDIGHLQKLRVLDLSNNSLNGTVPLSIFKCSDLQSLNLSSNFISGELPESLSNLQSLQVLDLSNNWFDGKLPGSLGSLRDLREAFLKSNDFTGGIPGGFDSVEFLDLSSNMLNGTLPDDFGGGSLNYLNLSNNKISGSVLRELAERIPLNAVVDLSFNNFSGEIPQTVTFSKQKTEYFAGNLDLCGKPLNKTCTVPSSLSTPPNVSAAAAIAAIPQSAGNTGKHGGRKFQTGKIVTIVIGDVAAVVLFAVLFFYAYRLRKQNKIQNPKEIEAIKIEEPIETSTSCSCFNGRNREEASETETESGSNSNCHIIGDTDEEKDKCLVMVDGETELEMETLLKSSAYVLGSSGGSILYKAVVGGGGGGVAFAVRRIGECGVEKKRDFEKMVRVLSKFRHRNLVKVRGFYWGKEEKLVIYDYVACGSLAGAANRNVGSSSCDLSFDIRLKIAKGIAKGLSYIHKKKHVHGNIKPSNILLTSEMDSVISDFGLEWLISGNKTNYNSTTTFAYKTSSSSREEMIINHDHKSDNYVSPYKAPEAAFKTQLKFNPYKLDVYSFGIILLELFSGKVFTDIELAQLDTETKIIDGLNGIDNHERKHCVLTCLKLGFSCASLAPRKRPSMKEASKVLERIPCLSSSP